MRKILPEYEFSDEQLNTIRKLALDSGFCEETVKILYGRGVKDADSIANFMFPSKSHFISPFKMSGMREAVELIKQAKEEDWTVVVYGDYDADGICASTIMRKVLRDYGIEVITIVPERTNGYGLSNELIDKIFDEYCPQLFITVDCGISCAEEVEYIKEQGAEVIVTDHHELPEKIPDCICINPKFNDGYIYDNLCGAGVAFKVGCALLGTKAYKYLDFAAIATVADSVPLVGENRDIVYEGLKIINATPNRCYSDFYTRGESAVTAQTLAFSIAPKINAAGRMGDAAAALQLFNETDPIAISELSAKLTAYNMERQKYCEEMFRSAKNMLAGQKIGRIIMLYNDEWNSGFVGIVAARLADEYARPTILFVKNGDTFRGSARSVEEVNIFEALKACDKYIDEFGGHAQAAGVNVKEENFAPLYAALEEYLDEHYTKEDFESVLYINGELEGDLSVRFVKELEMLEPYGVGNRKPLFLLKETALAARPLKSLSPHLKVDSELIEMRYFNGSKYLRLLESAAPKNIIFEYNVSLFHGKEYYRGFIRDVVYDENAGKYAVEEIALTCLDNLAQAEVDYKAAKISKSEIESLMRLNESVVFVAWSADVLEQFENVKYLDVSLFTQSQKCGKSLVVIAPQPDFDFSEYKRVVLLDNVHLNAPSLFSRKIEVYDRADYPAYFKKISTEREYLLGIHAQIARYGKPFDGFNCYEVAKFSDLEISKPQLMFALKVFEQMGLLTFASGRLEMVRAKSQLENSKLYNFVNGCHQ